ncbi:Transposable element Tc3 transposase [Anthophora quadrimaculata]
MGRGKPLNDNEKGQIIALKGMGLSNRKIADKVQRSLNVVNHFIKLGNKYATKKSTGRPKKLCLRDKGKIFQEARKNKLNASQIKTKLDLPIGVRRVQQVLRARGTLRYTKRTKKPPLTEFHKNERLKFAENHMAWTEKWKTVIFSDEKKFNLDGPDGFQYYWHDLRDQKEVKMSRNYGGGSVMIWAAIGYNGKTPIMWFPPKANAANYQELLEIALDQYGDEIGGPNFIFQHDNAAIHRAKTVQTWFQTVNVEVLRWPSRSPDLNPIENLWGILARRVYTNGKQYCNTMELKNCIKEAWSQIESETLHKLIDSMPKRIFEIIKNKGGSTKY